MENKKARKILTFSYDDGVVQDIRLVELFNKYGMKATFNLNSSFLGDTHSSFIRESVEIGHKKVKASEITEIYKGHEIAAHTCTHPRLTDFTDVKSIVDEVENDRLRLSELCGYEVVGMAYPFGDIPRTSLIPSILRDYTGVKYARNTDSTYNFARQENLYLFSPTVYHHREWDAMFTLGKKFLDLEPTEDSVFYIWGHAYEFDIHDTWSRFEEFLKMMSGRADIEYLTNKDALL